MDAQQLWETTMDPQSRKMIRITIDDAAEAEKVFVELMGVIVLIALIMISAVCFAIYNALLTYHPISEIAIYNALIPVLGVVISALLLQEPLKWQYILSVLLVAAGIWIINIKRSEVGRGHDSK